MKRKSIYRGYIGKGYSDQPEFSHRYAAWQNAEKNVIANKILTMR